MPTNLYGPGDNYDENNSHVIPALIRRIHQAKVNNQNSVKIWGSGKAKREFLHVNDMAAAAIHVMNLPKSIFEKYTNPMCSHINVGSGYDLSIKELAIKISEIIGFSGELIFDLTKPDGTPRKLLDISKINDLGWSSKIEITEGLKNTYTDFKNKTNQLNKFFEIILNLGI